MKKPFYLAMVLAVSIFAVTFTSASSFAWPYYHHHWHHWHPHPHPAPDPAVSAGILAGIGAAFLVTSSVEQSEYHAETLKIQAAQYEDTREKGAVFAAFANQVAEQMGDKTQQVTEEQFDDVVAQLILTGNLN